MKERSSRVVGDNPVANYRDDFAQSLEQSERSPNTIKNYLCDLDAFARWFETERKEELTPTKITPTDLREYKQFLTQKLALKPQSINRKLSTLRSFLSWAVHAELLPDHRIPRFPKAVQEKDRGPQWLDRHEQHALLRTVERGGLHRDLAIVKLLLNTGLRVSEVCGLTWGDIKITDRKGSLVVRTGKGRQRREVPLNKDARNALLSIGYLDKAGTQSYVFIGQRGPMTPRGVESMLKKYVHLAELDDVSPHSLRHTFCKNLIDAGVGLEKVAALAGHENLETTRRYCEPDHHDLEAAVELIGEEENSQMKTLRNVRAIKGK